MPLSGERLVIEPKYPRAKELMAMGPEVEPQEFKVRNQWFSTVRRCIIGIVEMPDGKIDWGLIPAVHGLDKQLHTLGCSDAWGLEQEAAAQATLKTLLTDRQWRHYTLTGSFLQSSKRSGLTYLFRRLRPTVVIRADHVRDTSSILCCLCMHPIAHYENSWAGAMCPTDDVIAHFSMMRADEAMYWKRCNQHPAYRPEGGL